MKKSTSGTPPLFSIENRVYYEDTDAAGVVYYANYLRFFERCRTEWVRAAGFDQGALAAEKGIAFVVREVQARYLKPAHLDDLLRTELAVLETGKARVKLQQQVWRLGTGQAAGEVPVLLVSGHVDLVCVNSGTFKPVEIPAFLYQSLFQGVL